MHPPLTIKIFKTSIHSFHFFGAMGYFLGLLLGVWLAYITNLTIWPVIVCGLTGAGVLFGLTYLYKALTGKEDLVYYQHEIAILVCCLALLFLLNQPVLPYLDITLMGIGIFLVFGRIGCFSVGCCHGKPHKKFGVVYSKEHVTEGFSRHYEGIRIFPIQLIESISALLIVSAGSYAILTGSIPGAALLLYTVIYGWIRFVLEFYRGDPERPYWLDFSEAQWTTLGVFVVSATLSLSGMLPHYGWHLCSVPALILLMITVSVVRKSQTIPVYKLLRPGHVSEIADALTALDNHTPEQGQILIAGTSLGLNISKGELKAGNETALHYTISGETANKENNKKNVLIINIKTAEIIGNLLQTLRHAEDQFEIVKGPPGIFHIIFPKHDQPDDGNRFIVGQSIALGLRRNLRHIYN